MTHQNGALSPLLDSTPSSGFVSPAKEPGRVQEGSHNNDNCRMTGKDNVEHDDTIGEDEGKIEEEDDEDCHVYSDLSTRVLTNTIITTFRKESLPSSQTLPAMDLYDRLPSELLELILSLLRHPTLFRCAALSKRWTCLVLPHLWHRPWMMYYVSWMKLLQTISVATNTRITATGAIVGQPLRRMGHPMEGRFSDNGSSSSKTCPSRAQTQTQTQQQQQQEQGHEECCCSCHETTKSEQHHLQTHTHHCHRLCSAEARCMAGNINKAWDNFSDHEDEDPSGLLRLEESQRREKSVEMTGWKGVSNSKSNYQHQHHLQQHLQLCPYHMLRQHSSAAKRREEDEREGKDELLILTGPTREKAGRAGDVAVATGQGQGHGHQCGNGALGMTNSNNRVWDRVDLHEYSLSTASDDNNSTNATTHATARTGHNWRDSYDSSKGDGSSNSCVVAPVHRSFSIGVNTLNNNNNVQGKSRVCPSTATPTAAVGTMFTTTTTTTTITGSSHSVESNTAPSHSSSKRQKKNKPTLSTSTSTSSATLSGLTFSGAGSAPSSCISCSSIVTVTASSPPPYLPSLYLASPSKSKPFLRPMYGHLIRVLDFSELYYIISDKFLVHLFPHTKNLTCLIIHSPKQFTDQALYVLASCCRSLQRLELLGCEQITDQGLHYLLDNAFLPPPGEIQCPRRRHYQDHQEEEEGEQEVESRTVSTATRRTTSSFVSNTATLCSLTLSNRVHLTDGVLQHLAYSWMAPRLERLDVSNAPYLTGGDPGLGTILRCCFNLVSLNISYLHHHSRLQDQENVIYLSTLLTGGTRGTTTDSLLENWLPFESRLRELVMAHCDQLTDRGLFVVAERCPWLETLDVTGCGRRQELRGGGGRGDGSGGMITEEGVLEVGWKCRRLRKFLMDRGNSEGEGNKISERVLEQFPWGPALVEQWKEQVERRRGRCGRGGGRRRIF